MGISGVSRSLLGFVFNSQTARLPWKHSEIHKGKKNLMGFKLRLEIAGTLKVEGGFLKSCRGLAMTWCEGCTSLWVNTPGAAQTLTAQGFPHPLGAAQPHRFGGSWHVLHLLVGDPDISRGLWAKEQRGQRNKSSVHHHHGVVESQNY